MSRKTREQSIHRLSFLGRAPGVHSNSPELVIYTCKSVDKHEWVLGGEEVGGWGQWRSLVPQKDGFPLSSFIETNASTLQPLPVGAQQEHWTRARRAVRQGLVYCLQGAVYQVEYSATASHPQEHADNGANTYFYEGEGWFMWGQTTTQHLDVTPTTEKNPK